MGTSLIARGLRFLSHLSFWNVVTELRKTTKQKLILSFHKRLNNNKYNEPTDP